MSAVQRRGYVDKLIMTSYNDDSRYVQLLVRLRYKDAHSESEWGQRVLKLIEYLDVDTPRVVLESVVQELKSAVNCNGLDLNVSHLVVVVRGGRSSQLAFLFIPCSIR